MPSVARIHASSISHLADTGGPTALLPIPARPSAPGPATVVHLRPAAGPGTVPYPTAIPGRSTQQAAPADADAVQRISGIARSVAQGALEVLAGSRPLQQMARWLDPENYERLQLRTNLVRCIDTARGAQRGKPPTSTRRLVVVRSARVCPVAPGIYEASVVAFDQKRIRAVALRIEQRRGEWRVTALEIG